MAVTTPTQEALMALADAYAAARNADRSPKCRAALASAIAEVAQEAERACGQRDVFARWMADALLTLDTIDPDDCEDGGNHLRMLTDSGQRLLKAAALSARSAAQKAKGV